MQRFHRTRRFQNPYFTRVRPKKRAPKIVAIAILALAVGLAWWYAFSGAFAFKGLIIEGADPEDAKTIAATVYRAAGEQTTFFRIERRTHRLLFETKDLHAILSSAVFAESISLSWLRQGILVVKLSPRTPRLLVRYNEKEFTADAHGFTVGEYLTTSSTPTLPELTLDLTSTPTPRLPLVAAPEQRFLFDLVQSGAGERMTSPPTRIVFQGQQQPFVQVYTAEGWYAKFNTNRTIDESLRALERVLSALPIDRARLEYIDVRFPDRVFYKER